jgi:hypothetical protein
MAPTSLTFLPGAATGDAVAAGKFHDLPQNSLHSLSVRCAHRESIAAYPFGRVLPSGPRALARGSGGGAASATVVAQWRSANENMAGPDHSPLMFAALMIGHHFSISAL